MEQRTLTFFAEWLRLPKEQFRILVMLADVGAFRGNLSDMCRYFSVDPQDYHRRRFRTAIDELARRGFITAVRAGNTYQMEVIPKAEEITMPAEWVNRIRRHEYRTEDVAWEIVLKVQLWLLQNANNGLITNDDIAAGVNSSVSQVVAAKNVLQNKYQAFIKEYAYWNTGNCFRRKGQIIDMSAWWTTS